MNWGQRSSGVRAVVGGGLHGHSAANLQCVQLAPECVGVGAGTGGSGSACWQAQAWRSWGPSGLGVLLSNTALSPHRACIPQVPSLSVLNLSIRPQHASALQAMQRVMANPEFVQAAESLGRWAQGSHGRPGRGGTGQTPAAWAGRQPFRHSAGVERARRLHELRAHGVSPLIQQGPSWAGGPHGVAAHEAAAQEAPGTARGARTPALPVPPRCALIRDLPACPSLHLPLRLPSSPRAGS